MQIIDYTPEGVCSRHIHIELDGDTVKSVSFTGGCPGNTQGVARLAEGRKVQDVISCLSGILCRDKTTSCPDQLARALKEALTQAQ